MSTLAPHPAPSDAGLDRLLSDVCAASDLVAPYYRVDDRHNGAAHGAPGAAECVPLERDVAYTRVLRAQDAELCVRGNSAPWFPNRVWTDIGLVRPGRVFAPRK